MNSSTEQYFDTAAAVPAVMEWNHVIQQNRELLSEIDGAIGDGDHGINMSTGFAHFHESVKGKELQFSDALSALGTTLLEVTGGSLGPLYGSMFLAMGESVEGKGTLDARGFLDMLEAGCNSLVEIGGAKRGDKTLLDCFFPAIDSYKAVLEKGNSFSDCLDALSRGAEEGKEATRDLVAKIGRASRLGERSRGVLDAGASSCALLLISLAGSIQKILKS